jgi:hypothetical protein
MGHASRASGMITAGIDSDGSALHMIVWPTVNRQAKKRLRRPKLSPRQVGKE